MAHPTAAKLPAVEFGRQRPDAAKHARASGRGRTNQFHGACLPPGAAEHNQSAGTVGGKA